MPDPLPMTPDDLLRTFLAETPAAQDEIRYVRLAEGDEPEPVFSQVGMRLLYDWMARTGRLTPAQAAALIAQVDAALRRDAEDRP